MCGREKISGRDETKRERYRQSNDYNFLKAKEKLQFRCNTVKKNASEGFSKRKPKSALVGTEISQVFCLICALSEEQYSLQSYFVSAGQY